MNHPVKEFNQELKSLEELSGILAKQKSSGKKIVQCHGVFDLLHIGHIRHFEQAKALGDVLVVTITPDHFVNKGPSRPAFGEQLRAEAVLALDCVDYVAVNKWAQADQAIKLLAPDFYVKGQDYKNFEDDLTGGILDEQEAVHSVGGQIAFTDDITFSSSNLINRHMPVLPEKLSDYLVGFSSKYRGKDVLSYLDGAQSLKVLVLGETIIDEYVYCDTLGKAGKEPVLVTRQVESERFAGGVVAVANHISAFCNHPTLLTFVGDNDSDDEFVSSKLDPNVAKKFLPMFNGASTIVKRRYVESYPFQKLFEVYQMQDGENVPEESTLLCGELEKLLPNYDAVIVTDYGHGMLGPDAVRLLSDKAKFLAVNTQVNAGNLGFNTVSKYPRADFICVSETEIRLEARSKRRPLEEIVLETSELLSCSNIIITRGVHGCLCYSKRDGFFEVPAFGAKVVDRIGAGDAVFAIAALNVAQNAPIELGGFVGNAVGAEAVASVGHRDSTHKISLYRHIETLLK